MENRAQYIGKKKQTQKQQQQYFIASFLSNWLSKYNLKHKGESDCDRDQESQQGEESEMSNGIMLTQGKCQKRTFNNTGASWAGGRKRRERA